ncbi:MAG: type II toxin-antitoxin system YafQ family toxin [Treponema sp.]|nr:type II toxin-antitoxin system YafQ family toxin [Treponema sp.]
MLNQRFTGPFKKDRKLMKRQNKDIDKLTEIMAMIVNERPLPPERENHPLHGEWKGCLECHIQGDWVLIYEIDLAENSVTFKRTGSHADMF